MKWIDKNEKQPPIGEFDFTSAYVLVTDGTFIAIGTYSFEYNHWTYTIPGYVECDNNAITHWMPLPTPPQQ